MREIASSQIGNMYTASILCLYWYCLSTTKFNNIVGDKVGLLVMAVVQNLKYLTVL